MDDVIPPLLSLSRAKLQGGFLHLLTFSNLNHSYAENSISYSSFKEGDLCIRTPNCLAQEMPLVKQVLLCKHTFLLCEQLKT